MNSWLWQPWTLVCTALLFSTPSTTLFAADEVIIIIGEPTGWCSGPGQEIVDQVDLDTCQCTQGWEPIEDENADGEPLCGVVADTGGTGPGDPDGGEPPTGGDTNPPKPTAAQCDALHNECLRNANTLVDTCRSSSMRVFSQQLANGFACHGQTLDDLVAGFDYRLLGVRVSCDASDFRDIDDPGKDNCRIQAIRRGRDRCQFGVKSSSTTHSASDSFSATFKTPVWELGGTSTSETSITVQGQGGMGSDQMCMGMGLKAAAQCASQMTACTSKTAGGSAQTEIIVVPLDESAGQTTTEAEPVSPARPVSGPILNFEVQLFHPGPAGPAGVNGPANTNETESLPVSPQSEAPTADTMAPPDLQDLLKDRIDQARLGFSDGTFLGAQTYRPIARSDTEFADLYIERLRFLANWSSFLRAHDIEESRQQAVENTLAKIQSEIDDRRHRHAQILWALWSVDLKTGVIGSNEAHELRDTFQREGGVWREVRSGDAAIRKSVSDTLSPDLAQMFFEDVWPGVVLFALARPMANGPPVVTIEN